jgi:hypothetical protein
MLTQIEHNNAVEKLRVSIIGFRALIDQEPEMRFSLKYEGPLKSSNSRKTHVADKNRLRWYFSDQLERLIERGNFSRLPLNETYRAVKKRDLIGPVEGGIKLNLKNVSGSSLSNIWYFSAIDRSFDVACSLNVRMDRRERPGHLFETSGENTGDLDNRFKTLFDALRMPHSEDEARPNEDDPAKSYCVCLFEDDSMVSNLTVSTHPSLEELPPGHIKLTIDIEIKAHDLTFDLDS